MLVTCCVLSSHSIHMLLPNITSLSGFSLGIVGNGAKCVPPTDWHDRILLARTYPKLNIHSLSNGNMD